MTPTARSLEWCRRQNIDAGVVERYSQYSRTRHDLFGVIDLVVMDQGLLGVQATSGAHAAERRDKILAEPRARRWIESGGRLEIWAWRQIVARRKDGSKAKVRRWELRRDVVTLQDFEAADAAEVE